VSLPVRTTPEAEAQIAAVDVRWRLNRLAAPDLFLDELAASLDLISHAPFIGRSYRPSPIPGTRRVLLKRSRYHVYYAPLAAEVRVLAVWHGHRGTGPDLVAPWR
jgi:plasmid stabilization system protein ParE